MHATQRVRRQICVKTCFYLILEFLRFLLCKEGTKEAYGTHPLVRCCFARRAQRASPQRGEVAERQRWPVGLCPFPAARSLTGKLRAGHARPLRLNNVLPCNNGTRPRNGQDRSLQSTRGPRSVGRGLDPSAAAVCHCDAVGGAQLPPPKKTKNKRL